jgi:spore coat polysaccharide biosynthesis protein SpsF
MTGREKREAVAVVQARMTSTRLPGKVMMPVLGKPLLGYELERIARAGSISRIVVATTRNGTDDVVERYVSSLGFGVYRGSEDDVLGRYREAAAAFGASVVARLTADCPLIDPAVIDHVVNAFFDDESAPDYASNVLGRRTYPRGLDTEVFTAKALEKSWKEAELPSEREHVTPYMYNHPEIFKLKGIYNGTDLSIHRWTVDTKEDFTLIKLILEALYPSNSAFSLENIVNLMDSNSSLFDVNSHIRQKH